MNIFNKEEDLPPCCRLTKCLLTHCSGLFKVTIQIPEILRQVKKATKNGKFWNWGPKTISHNLLSAQIFLFFQKSLQSTVAYSFFFPKITPLYCSLPFFLPKNHSTLLYCRIPFFVFLNGLATICIPTLIQQLQFYSWLYVTCYLFTHHARTLCLSAHLPSSSFIYLAAL